MSFLSFFLLPSRGNGRAHGNERTKDPRHTDIIEAWEPVEDIGEMPEENLCSECYGAKLSLMQQSPYSVYGETHAEILAYINERKSS